MYLLPEKFPVQTKILLLLPALLFLSFKPKEKRYTVEIKTDFGIMKVMLYNETPKTRDNFLKLVNQHFYDSTLFHRVIKDFMIQGGDPDSKHAPSGMMLGNGDLEYTVPAEFNPAIIHKKGVIAMARDENPQKASSGCQFYIVQGKKITDEELEAIEQHNGIKYTAEQTETYKTSGGTPRLDQNYTVFGELYEGWNVLDSIAGIKTDGNDRPLQDLRMHIKEGKKIKIK
ncbi:MAG: peptidylprolyl isomerase [Chitinophagales bacterium]|nr:peptidylprolyl isomerase [Chitinophagales bacterium]